MREFNGIGLHWIIVPMLLVMIPNLDSAKVSFQEGVTTNLRQANH